MTAQGPCGSSPKFTCAIDIGCGSSSAFDALNVIRPARFGNVWPDPPMTIVTVAATIPPTARAPVRFLSLATLEVNKHSLHASLVWRGRSEEHTSELQSLRHLVCRLL